MRKFISLLLTLLLILSVAVLFAGCGETSVSVESTLKTDENFNGSQTLIIKFPGSMSAETLLPDLERNLPENDNWLTIGRSTSTNKENALEMVLSFSSQQDYTNKASALVGREVSVNLATPDNILTKGTRFEEDFDVSEMLTWMSTYLKKNNDIKNIKYNVISSVLDLNGALFSTGSTANINEITGSEINSIAIDTTNSKEDKYDRQFVFEVPESVYKSLGDDLKSYFQQNTNVLAEYSDWANRGNVYEYQVIFKGLDIDSLAAVTNQLLNVSDGSITYGDLTNSSTPLSEGLTYEENLDFMSFMGKDKSPVPVTYSYSLPTNTTCSEGSVYEKGSWITAGDCNSTTYTLKINSNVKNIHIPDGIQYEIAGMHFNLNNNGGDNFTRTVDILYGKDNIDGLDYAYNFFKNKNADVSKINSDTNYICRITTSGTALEISEKTVDLFGGGNYMNYEYDKRAYQLTDNTNFVDYINIGYMLIASNAEKPMDYTITGTGNEKIVTVDINASNNKQKLKNSADDGSFTLNFKGGNASVSYAGSVADYGKITIYIVISAIILFLTIVLLMFMYKKSMKPNKNSNAVNLEQTTVFSIKELTNGKNKEDDDNV